MVDTAMGEILSLDLAGGWTSKSPNEIAELPKEQAASDICGGISSAIIDNIVDCLQVKRGGRTDGQSEK